MRGPDRPFHIGATEPVAAPSARGADTAAFVAALAEPDDRTLPEIDLGATRMLEVGIAWAGPLAARTLGDLGVDVVKIEHPLSRGLGAGTGTVDGLAVALGRARPRRRSGPRSSR